MAYSNFESIDCQRERTSHDEEPTSANPRLVGVTYQPADALGQLIVNYFHAKGPSHPTLEVA